MRAVLTLALLVVAAPALAQSDTTPPSLTSFDFDPKSLDVTSGPGFYKCRSAVTDAISGVDLVDCRFRSPSGAHQTGAQCGTPVSGDSHNGVWECLGAVEQYQEEGTWTLSSVWVRDAADNSRFYYTSELQSMGFPTTMQVTSSPDVTAPELTGFDFTPRSVDVTSSPGWYTCHFEVSDALSGVDLVDCRFRSPSGAHQAGAQCGTPVSGDSHNGVWECLGAVEQYQEEGTWTLSSVWVRDAADNSRFYYTSELQSMGFPTVLRVGFLDGSPRAVITVPRHTKRISGNSITVRAHLIQGTPADVSPVLGVRFEYRALPSGVFIPIPAANPNHPNPDTSYPYFIHWNVATITDGNYEIRAVAHDRLGAPDPSPEAITATVVHAGPADVEENLDVAGRQESQTSVDDLVETTAGSADHTTTSAAGELRIPAGALSLSADRARLYYPDPTLEMSKLEQPDRSLGIFLDVSLESGQSTFENGLAADLNITYSDTDHDGLIDGTTIREDEIECRRYDPDSDAYEVVPSTILTEHNMIHTDTTVAGRFALTGPQLPRVDFDEDRVTLTWASIATASRYNVYRGLLTALVDLNRDGRPDSGYGDCQNHSDPVLTDTAFTDLELPGHPGDGFTYLISFVQGGAESTLGNSSGGQPRYVTAACP